MRIFKPPYNIALRDKSKSVFLAGSIEMGNSDDWQTEFANYFSKRGWNVFNPRRDEWDSTWKQTFESPNFYQQVSWELNAMSQADMIIMYLLPNTISPISLLELGLYAKSGKLRVICPDGFWRKGNIDVVCNYYNIPLYENKHDLMKEFYNYNETGH